MSSTKDFFRSAEMEYISIVLQEHIAHSVISTLGSFSCIQFTDLNPTLTPIQRPYTSQISRCETVQKKLAYFSTLFNKYSIPQKIVYSVDDFLVHPFLNQTTSFLQKVEETVEEKEKELILLDTLRDNLITTVSDQVQYKHVLDAYNSFTSSNQRQQTELSFQYLCGTIAAEEKSKFERVLFRMSRGNLLIKFFPLELSEDEKNLNLNLEQKTMFLVFFNSSYIKEKMLKIADAFSAQLFSVESADSSAEKVLRDQVAVLQKAEGDIELSLKELTQWVQIWDWIVRREKAIYLVLNSSKQEVKNILRLEGWILKQKKEQVIQKVSESFKSVDLSFKAPYEAQNKDNQIPTYFETNKVTSVFQTLIDTYGVPRYREANPALLSVVTFPFLFGVMFGDLGHGFILFLVSLLICIKEKDIQKMDLGEMGEALFSARYFLLLMGFFSFFCGLMYNDYFAMGLELFPTTFEIQNEDYEPGQIVTYIKKDDDVYPVGIDPTWHHASNGLLFFNSVKMKMAVIFGVVQMSVGLFLKVSNALYFGKKLDLFFEAIPQIIFLLGLFGYMCFLIVYKWAVDWGEGCSREDLNCNPPSLITTLINMALDIGNVEQDMLMYENQGTIQTALLLISVLMVPLMLLPKPIILSRQLKDHHGDGDEEHSAGDLWVHQGIETVEFCLSCLSNTASYLRLWALSLAHSQLSAVFLEQLLLNYVTTEGPMGVIITFLGFGAFAGATLAVILLMDNMECFLHALRLHWVEFQSKFYAADGVKFVPLDFKQSLKV
eukprot:snap_masked-scaffold_21-processed-gene-2.23-mRNA-1 protein AED:0.01 eAED:0.01 QI:0/-1/0/1/-1/1/1/0/774